MFKSSFVIASAAKQSRATCANDPGLPRRYAPRNDGLRALALAAALFATPAFAAEPQTVTIDNFSFKPNVITVKPGTHVVFKNQDDLPHSVVIPDMQVKSALMDTDGSYEADFEKPGEYKYFCGIHPMMTGKVIVAE
jgi:plastocyanin